MSTPYRVLVTGSRDWSNQAIVWQAIASTVIANTTPDTPVVIVHGACPTGADVYAAVWAGLAEVKNRRPVVGEPHRAEDFGPWPACGPIRNQHMVNLGADQCLAFIGPCTSPRCRKPRPHPSHGASGCAELAENAGIPTRRWTA